MPRTAPLLSALACACLTSGAWASEDGGGQRQTYSLGAFVGESYSSLAWVDPRLSATHQALGGVVGLTIDRFRFGGYFELLSLPLETADVSVTVRNGALVLGYTALLRGPLSIWLESGIGYTSVSGQARHTQRNAQFADYAVGYTYVFGGPFISSRVGYRWEFVDPDAPAHDMSGGYAHLTAGWLFAWR